MKNRWFFQAGPPAAYPYWSHLNGAFGAAACEAVKEYGLASQASSRWNSNPVPCRVFVPDLVTTFTWLASRPNSAEYTPVCTLNSSSASTEGRKIYVLKLTSVLST